MTEYYQEKIDALSNFLGEKPTNANYKNNVEFTLDNENWYEVFNEEEMKDEMEERASMEYYDFLSKYFQQSKSLSLNARIFVMPCESSKLAGTALE